MPVEIAYRDIMTITLTCDVAPNSGDRLKLTPASGATVRTAKTFFLSSQTNEAYIAIGATRENLRQFAHGILAMLKTGDDCGHHR